MEADAEDVNVKEQTIEIPNIQFGETIIITDDNKQEHIDSCCFTYFTFNSDDQKWALKQDAVASVETSDEGNDLWIQDEVGNYFYYEE